MWPWTRPAGLSTGWNTTSRELGWLGPDARVHRSRIRTVPRQREIFFHIHRPGLLRGYTGDRKYCAKGDHQLWLFHASIHLGYPTQCCQTHDPVGGTCTRSHHSRRPLWEPGSRNLGRCAPWLPTLLGQRINVARAETVVYTTHLDNDTKPFPGSHPLHSTEIDPAAGLISIFLKGVTTNFLRNIMLRVPVAISAPRSVQVVVQQDEIKIMSQLIQNNDSTTDSASWVTHTTAQWNNESTQTSDIDIDAVKTGIGTHLRDDFTIDYLSKVGVSAMGFPWAISEHYGNTKEIIARVSSTPDVAPGTALPWDASSWAPILDAARLHHLHELSPSTHASPDREGWVFTHENPPRTAWLYVEEVSDTALASHGSVCSDAGKVVAKFTSIRFSEIEGIPGLSGSMGSLVHQITWPPATLMENPLPISHVVLVCNNLALRDKYAKTLPAEVQVLAIDSSKDLTAQASYLPLRRERLLPTFLARCNLCKRSHEPQKNSHGSCWKTTSLSSENRSCPNCSY